MGTDVSALPSSFITSPDSQLLRVSLGWTFAFQLEGEESAQVHVEAAEE